MTLPRVLVTGAAGFIGSNLVDELLAKNYEVIGVDNFNDYYSPSIKKRNLSKALGSKKISLHQLDICEALKLEEVFKKERPDVIVHLAARAGVRPSITDPELYLKTNVLGTINILKCSQAFAVEKFVFGSSSSVYGNSTNAPFREDDLCQKIASPYGATKRSAEFFVESFYHNFGLKAVVLRFFTVYGERGRPDMAPAIFAKAIIEGKPVVQFGNGTTSRDYTYIDDIVSGIILAIEKDLSFEIINLGNSSPVKLREFILTLETIIGKKARIQKTAKQIGDVDITYADINKAKRLLDWEPKVKLPEGLSNYVRWLKNPN